MTKELRNDQKDYTETIGSIRKGDLHVRDLGYIRPTCHSAVVGKEAFFLNRLPPQCLILTKKGNLLIGKRQTPAFKQFSRNWPKAYVLASFSKISGTRSFGFQ